MAKTTGAGAESPILPARVRTRTSITRRRRRRTVLIRLGAGTCALLVALGVAAGILAHQVSQVRSQLEHALSLVPQMRLAISEADSQQTAEVLDQIQDYTAAARQNASGPLWRFASMLPLIGTDFHAITVVTVSADDILKEAGAPMLDLQTLLRGNSLGPVDGQIDVASLEAAAPGIAAASRTVRNAHDGLKELELSTVTPQVADGVRKATEQLGTISDALGAGSSAAQLLPGMLGSEGPRNYLVLVQNNAEVRATGGIPGVVAVLNTDGGKITLGEVSSAVALGSLDPPLEVDPQQEALYTNRLGSQLQNVNLTPDFPTAASTAKAMWEHRHGGQHIDGVLALDPVVLSHLLQVTGPVQFADPDVLDRIKETSLPSSLTSNNVVPTLLSDVYREIEEPDLQDKYFAAVAGSVFAAFSDGNGNQMMKGLTTSFNQQRLFLWSARTEEQEIIETSRLAGSVAGPEADPGLFGVYFNDGTGAKMDYYAARTVQLLEKCSDSGYSAYTVRISVSNKAPADASSSLPAYVTGGGAFRVNPGNIRTNYIAYGPPLSMLETAALDGKPIPVGAGNHDGRPVGTVTVELSPGESAVLDVTFSGITDGSEPRVRMTPTIAKPSDAVLSTQRDQSCS